MFISDTAHWSKSTFGTCDLGDKRRTKRLIQMVTSLARNIGQSVVKSMDNDSEVEGAYRLLRNPKVLGKDIAEGGFQATATLAKKGMRLLALEDTTSLNFSHGVSEGLGYIGPPSQKKKGIQVHSIVLVNAQSKETLGLIEQTRWHRKASVHAKKNQRLAEDYTDKESFKWQRSSEKMAARLGDDMRQVISVCDRESDIYEYLDYKVSHQQGFVIRTRHNRKLNDSKEKLFERIRELKGVGTYTLDIVQKRGRKARQATMELAYAPVRVLAPDRKQKDYSPIELTVVSCRETSKTDHPVEWILLTTEVIKTAEDARRIVGYYAARWKIEEFHKAWKSGGTQIEKSRLQSEGNLERMAVILSFIAIRLLQLREVIDTEKALRSKDCSHILNNIQWRILWQKLEKKNTQGRQNPV
ncbi:MAG: IS4 family transposase [Enterobacterales bacterium]|nr:IS4 family transposase [Enterobacterales bacterium]